MRGMRALFFDVFGTCVDWRSSVRRELAQRGLPEAIADEWRGLAVDDPDELNRAWHRLDPWPDTVPGLTALKREHIIAPCSNGHIALIVNMAKHAGLPWDVVLGAEVAHAYKPDADAYLRSAAALGLKPREVTMVAAHNGDLHAARAVGMGTAFVPRPTEHGPDQTTDLEPEDDWDVVAPDFAALVGAAAHGGRRV